MPSPDTLLARGQADAKSALSGGGGSGGSSLSGYLARARSRPDPHMQFDWDVVIQVAGLSFKPEFVEEVNVPAIQLASEAIYRAGGKLYISTTHDQGAVTMRLYEDVQFTSTKFLQTWYGLIHESDGSHGIPAKYKGHIEVYPLTPTGERVAVIKCVGVFPTQMPPYKFGSDNDRTILDVEFSCDGVAIEFPR